MSEHSTEHASPEWPHPASEAARLGGHYAPGERIPGPLESSGPTRWGAPVPGYVTRPDGASGWGQDPGPASVPPPVAGVHGPHTAPGWLLRGRRDDDPDGAA